MAAAPPISPCEPLIAVLGRLAGELRRAAEETDRLHGLVEGVERGDPAAKAERICSAQTIDSLEQTLSSLASYIAALGALSSPRWKIAAHEALREVKLAELAARLADRAGADPDRRAPGELEFF